jgi:hypothetical protein
MGISRFIAVWAALAGAWLALAGAPASALTVESTSSIYAVGGSVSGAGDGATLATAVPVVGGQTVSVSASGDLTCCFFLSNPSYYGGADGIRRSPYLTTSGLPVNGLSQISGNSFMGLMGVFGDGTDPRGNSSPSGLTFNADSPSSRAPLLWQVFYVGDGHEGYENSNGGLLTFMAPEGATVLYLGFSDQDVSGPPCCYPDNRGHLNVEVSAVPAPAACWMLLSGLPAFRIMRRRNAA